MVALLALGLAASVSSAAKPNIVYVMTDDQDIELGGLTPMEHTRQLLGEQGAVGEAFYIATPICCPSRTETLSGRVYHNVLNDDLSGCMHVNSTGYIFQHQSSLFPALQRAGYMTGGFGKIINGQKNVFAPKNAKAQPITDGWDWLSVPMDEGNYFGPDHFEKRPNGTIWHSSLGDPKDVVDSWYQTTQIFNRSFDFIRAAVAAKQPFVAYLGPHAPHYSADAPPWARDLFSDMKAPRTPAWNTSEGQEDKTQHVAQNPPISVEMERFIDVHFRDRWRSIVGVDDKIAELITELETLGVLDNTYVFFTSDHGYKLGEWRLGCSKQHPYETDVHIPFFARGPGITPGTRVTALGSNIDIAPTFINIAGLPPNPEHDGKSLLPMLHSQQGTTTRETAEAGWRTRQIIEYASVGTYYNDHAKLWLSGPGATPGTPPTYGNGPATVNASFKETNCPATEMQTVGKVGEGVCYFVDSQHSNNWIALRVRNSTHNYMYVESFGITAMNTRPIGGHKGAKGVFKCLDGDLCQNELYDYGPITSDYPHFPVMTRERWNMVNSYKSAPAGLKSALHAELKAAYCDTRRLDVDRMGCSSSEVAL